MMKRINNKTVVKELQLSANVINDKLATCCIEDRTYKCALRQAQGKHLRQALGKPRRCLLHNSENRASQQKAHSRNACR